MENTMSIWSRLSHWLRLGGRGNGRDLPGACDDPGDAATADGSDGQEAKRLPRALSRWTRRDHMLQRIQEGHERVVELVGSIQRHFEIQERRGEDIAQTLHRVSDALTDASVGSRQQVELLSTMASRLAETNERSGALMETVQAIPASMREQQEALASIDGRLESAGEADTRMADSLNSFGTCLDSVSTSSSAQLEVLRQINEAATRHNEELSELIAHQNRRVSFLFALMSVFGIVVIAAVGITLWFLLNRF